MNKYRQYRICSSCDFEDVRYENHFEASFEEKRIWETPCPKCGRKFFQNSGFEIPFLSEETLTEWGNNEQIHFMDQDEDIIIAEEQNLELLVQFLDNENILTTKRSILLSALCILLFDNLPDEVDSEENDEINKELAEDVKEILLKRLKYFDELNSNWIDDYIKELVYPELGLNYQKT